MKQIVNIFFFLFILTAYGQKQANIWYFGSEGGLDFNCSPPMPIIGKGNVLEGCASISDSLGNFLFFTDGDSVWDKNHDIMPNGFGLGGNCDDYGYSYTSGTQAALIVPQPGNNSLYYIFTTDCVEDTLVDGFRYSIVDMNLNSGNGGVTIKRQLLFAPSCEKIAATKHANGNDIWVISHEFGTNTFYSFLLSNTGLSSPVITSTGQIHNYTPIYAMQPYDIPEQMGRGYLKFSPNGNRLISLEVPDDYNNLGYSLYVLHPEIFSFDNSTGIMQSQYLINHPDSLVYYGASFSPDGNIIYLSSAWYASYVHQFNLLAGTQTDIVNSRLIIFNDTNYNENPSALQLATDGKIYVATNRQWVDIINNPNSIGVSCNYQQQAIFLHDCPYQSYSQFGLPNLHAHKRICNSTSFSQKSKIAKESFYDGIIFNKTSINF